MCRSYVTLGAAQHNLRLLFILFRAVLPIFIYLRAERTLPVLD